MSDVPLKAAADFEGRPQLADADARAALTACARRMPLTEWLLAGPCKHDVGESHRAKTILEYEEVTDGDLPALVGLPLLVTHCDYPTRGDGVAAEAAGRRVGEMVDRTVAGTWDEDPPPRGHRLFGLANHPKGVRLTANESVADMVDVLWGHGFCGPYGLLHDPGEPEFDRLRRLFVVSPGGDGRQLEVTLFRNPWLRPAGSLAPGGRPARVLFQATPDVVQVVEARPPQVFDWGDGKAKVLTVRVPRVRTTAAGHCGVVVRSAA